MDKKINVEPNTLFTNDNLFVLNGMNSACVDLIYLDPPFNSKRFYSAPIGSKAAGASFKDMWSWDDVDFALLQRLNDEHPDFVRFVQSVSGSHGSPMRSYITYMAQRVFEMHRILKPTGSFYLHCDPTASHYLKMMLDFIFGSENFRNELIWCYKERELSKKQWNKKHDVILFFTKSDDFTFNWEAVAEEYSEYTVGKKFKYTDEQGNRYRLRYKDGRNDPAQENEDTYRQYMGVGVPPRDWFFTPILNQASKERTGYPTQKPLALLNRIVQASSNEGDMVLDPFCGCATTCIAAQHLHRHWIGIDVEKKSGDLIAERLANDVGGILTNFIHRTDLPRRTDLATLNLKNPRVKRELVHTLYGEQAGRCNGCKSHFEIQHFDLDHIIPKNKGGGDFRGNLQLLCGNCNSIKGSRPMEYLTMRIKNRESRQEIFVG